MEWCRRLKVLSVQHPLIASHSSVAGLRAAKAAHRPRAVLVGIGLCGNVGLSAGVPLDVVGMLAPAEMIRRELGARELVVLVADEHARGVGFDSTEIDRLAQQWTRMLSLIRNALRLDSMRVVAASQLHRMDEYRSLLRDVKQRAPKSAGAYFLREVADIAFFEQSVGGLVKVGWTLDSGRRLAARRDEIAFDSCYRRWMGRPVPVVYCKPGRTLDDGRRKAPPYIAVDPVRRICLHPKEDPYSKLVRARQRAHPATVNGVERHLKAITRSVAELGVPLRGGLDQRLKSLYRRIFGVGEMGWRAQQLRRGRSASTVSSCVG